jgi:hypothetical protein
MPASGIKLQNRTRCMVNLIMAGSFSCPAQPNKNMVGAKPEKQVNIILSASTMGGQHCSMGKEQNLSHGLRGFSRITS